MRETRSPRLDEYIETAPPFARPIINHLRTLVHEAAPEIEEALKWGHPSFLLHGRIIFGIAAFKSYCRIGFGNPEVSSVVRRERGTVDDEGGQFGRVARREDLPDDDTLRRYLAEAVRLGRSDKPARRPSKPKANAPKAELVLPEDLAALLAKNPGAVEAFAKFSPSHRREYVEWIVEAKQAETRTRRLATTLEWVMAGKPRNWKHMKRRS